MKKTLALLLLSTSLLTAATPKPETPAPKTLSPKEQADKAAKEAKEALEKKKEADKKANEAADLAKRARRSADLGVTPKLTVVNRTRRTLTLMGNNGKIAQLAANVIGQIVSVPAGTEYVYIDGNPQDRQSLANGIQALSITVASNIGSYSYDIAPLTLNYGNHLLIVNGTSASQAMQVTFTYQQGSGVISKIKQWFSGNSSVKLSLSHTLEANETRLITIPKFDEITIDNAQIHLAHQDPITIDHNESTSYLIGLKSPGHPQIVEIKAV